MFSCPASAYEKAAIVFVHGILGFDAIALPGISIQYFRKLAENLSFSAADVLFAKLPIVGSIAERARYLRSFISCIGAQKLILIAHSMGGLDCRYLIQRFDPEKRVRTLVTVGTPHHGTPLANWFLQDKSWVAKLGKVITRPGIEDLATEACRRFNDAVPNRSDVRYLSYAGCRPIAEIPSLLKPFSRIIQDKAGENDGEVPVSSARWGDFRGELRADHLELAGWSFALPDRKIARPFDHIAFYRGIVQEILGLLEVEAGEKGEQVL
jgi:triacylglycerol lipase